MADKCIVFVNNNKQHEFSEQNQNICEQNQSSVDLSTETAIERNIAQQIESATSIALANANSSTPLSTKLKTVKDGISIVTQPSATMATALVQTDHAVRSHYQSENDEDDEDDAVKDVSERDHDLLFAGVIGGHSEKTVYLETPVLDDNNELLDIDTTSATNTHQPQHHCKRICYMLGESNDEIAPKPKRLSDEFFSADDGENDDNDDQIGDDENVDSNELAAESISDTGCDVVDASDTNIRLLEGGVSESSKPCATIVVRAAVVEEEISTCSLNLISDVVVDNPGGGPQHLDDSSSPHSSISPDSAIVERTQQGDSVADVVEELTNQGDEHPHHRIANENNIMFSNHSNSNQDVQSMDAIERSDFEIEQKATGSRILGNNSLNHRNSRDDVRLNLGLRNNSFSQGREQLSETATTDKMVVPDIGCVEAKPCKSSCTSGQATAASSGSGQLVTTPTSSRIKRSRFNINGSNLSKSLDKCSQKPSADRSAVDGEKLEYFPNNSNDSLSCDNQYAMEQHPVSESVQTESCDVMDSEKISPSGSKAGHCSVCSARKEDAVGESKETDDILEEEDEDDDEEDVEVNYPNDALRPSTSKGGSNRSNCCDCVYSPRTHTCACASKSKKDVGTDAPSSSVSFRRFPSKPTSTGHNGNISDELNNLNNFKLMMGLETENSYDDWSCEANSDTEEVCTCRDFTDDEVQASSEDELPSRDVDLSCYSITEDVLNGNSTDTPTSRNHRKRKLTETRTPLFCDLGSSGNIDPLSSDRKRVALDNVTIKCGVGPSPTTPTTNGPSALNSPSSTVTSLRTPRSVIPTRDNPPPELSDWLSQFQQWSHVERLLAVDRLIEHCEPTQVRHMMKVIEPQFQRDFISLLPKEVALQVLSYLPPKDLLRAAQTCRSWRFLCDDNLLWKEKCKQTGICIESSTDRPRRGRVGNMPPISSPWKAAYMRQHIIEMNWRSRPIRDPKVLKGHDDHVITCLQFYGNRIVSGSDDNTLKVWSAITGKCLRTLVGHTGGVWSSQMSANIIISGSTDRTLKVWNADNGNCIHTLMGHTSTVRCMHLHEKTVVSGSRDATLRVWDIVQGRCLHTLVGHLAAVRCVQYDGKLVVSGAYDYMVKVWNPETEECLHTLQGHTNRVYSLQFDGVHVVSGSLDTSIRVWDAATGTCKHTLMGHQSLTSGMELRQNILVSGNADSTVKVWDITNGQCLQTLSGSNKHQSAVTCLQFNTRFVITSSDDGTVKLWDVRTGEFIRNLVSLDSGGSGGVVWRIRSNDTKLICAVGSRNGTEETKLMVLDFDVEGACLKCS